MRFGIFFELQLPRPWTLNSEHKLFQEALEQVELADRLGFEYVWAVEHHFLEEYSHCAAPEVFLAAASQRSKRIRLGHGVLLTAPTFNHPARSAERIATLDLLSNGRVELGTGQSATALELGGFNIAFAEKKAQWEEGIEAVVRCLSEEPFTGVEGKYVAMPPRNVVPKPRQRPHPPLWLACSHRDTIIQAAQSGLGALTFAFAEPEQARGWVEAYERHLERCNPIGLRVDPELACVSVMMVHRDQDEALRRGLEGGDFFNYSLSYYTVFGDHVPGGAELWRDFVQKRRDKGYELEAALAERRGKGASAMRSAIGSPAQVREYVKRYEAAGVDQLIFIVQAGRTRHEHIMEALELFGRELLPEFQERDERQRAAKASRLRPLIDAALARRESRTRPYPAGYRVPPLAKRLYTQVGGEVLLQRVEDDSALGRESSEAEPSPAPAPSAPRAAAEPAAEPTEPQAFLSEEWFQMVEALRAAIDPPLSDSARQLVMNVTVLDGPDGDVEARLAGGRFLPGAASDAAVGMTLRYELAKKVLVENDVMAGMQGLFEGKIRIQGDMDLLVQVWQSAPPTPESERLQERVRELTFYDD